MTTCSRSAASRRLSFLCLLPAAAVLSACADDTEVPSVEKPAIVGVATGEVITRKDYADTVEANNRRNDERGSRGDWSYVKPAVGPKD